MATITEQETSFKKQLSYSMQEATLIARDHFNLSDEYKCFSLDATDWKTTNVVEALVGHEDPTVDAQAYKMYLPTSITISIPTGQLAFDITG
ncbi:hypothetical protein ACQR3P_29185 [Rhodococcus sp. IEGM1300]